MSNIKRLRLPFRGKLRRPSPEEDFGARLRELRKEKHYTQMDLARAAGLNPTQISRCERGLQNVSLKTIYKLAKGLGKEAFELLKPPTAS